jgi:hypothetical protein
MIIESSPKEWEQNIATSEASEASSELGDALLIID